MMALYNAEQMECACCQSLLNTASLYGTLKGGQTDLFKCILLNSLQMMSPKGYMGMIHPDTVYTEAKGQTLREYLYPRLVARYHYTNRLGLFSEVEGKKIFDCCIYKGEISEIKFDTISNVCHPNTIDASYAHTSNELCLGLEYVDEEGKKHLNTAGHHDRIVHINEDMLKLIGKVFEDTTEWESCRLVSIYTSRNLNIIRTFEKFNHVTSANPFITVALDATNSLKDGTMQQVTKYPDYENYEMIFNSTQVGILSPFSKMPQKVCTKDAQYDGVDYSMQAYNDDIRTNYIPKKSIVDFKKYINESGEWFERYKAGFKKMMDPTHERTLKGGILPPKSAHTHSILSLSFPNQDHLIEFVGLSASVVFDFFMKSVGVRNFVSSVAGNLPIGIDKKYLLPLKNRVLRMNCVNHWYEDLWQSAYEEEMKNDSWSSDDSRLSSFALLEDHINEFTLLKNDYERRMALVELDVIAAMAMGFTLDDLLFIYINTFSTTQKYEADTWYDANGRVVFSVSSEYDLKLDRKGNARKGIIGWEEIRGEEILEDGKVIGYKGTTTTLDFEIDSSRSEAYSGKVITFVAPYTKCDRIEDYRRAWAHFERIFNC